MKNLLRLSTVAAAAAAAVFLAGCVAPPERVVDPFAEIDAGRLLGQAAYPGVSVAYVYTENAKNALRYADASRSTQAGGRDMFDLRKPIEGLITQLRANFKSLKKADSIEEARASGADLVAMIDVYEKLGSFSFQLQESAAFVDAASGDKIDTVSASSKKTVADTGIKMTGQQEGFVMVEDAVRDSFQANLAGSQPLQMFARQHGGLAAASARPKGGRSDVDAPSYKSAEDPGKFALVVGVEDYESLPPADYAERDARAVRDHLLALGYPQRNVIFLTGQQAGKSGIEKYVESWLPRNVDENSQVFVYFSGHGAPDVKSGRAFLMPWDADAKFVDATGYPVKRLYDRLATLKARRVVVALDSCFSGAGGRSVIAQGARPLITQVDAGLPSTDKLVVLAAASGDEITGAADGQAHGLFTYYLLKGLNEKGGSASAKSLYDFLKPKVEDAARRDNRDQTPRLLSADAPAAAKL